VLRQAKELARTDYVIEFEDNGAEDPKQAKPLKSIRTAFKAAVKRAKLAGVTPHVLRHTAGVWMAEAGVPMAKIAQYMGHSDSRITERVYARFAPEHLQDAANALDVGAVQSNRQALSPNGTSA
jgi:integrase